MILALSAESLTLEPNGDWAPYKHIVRDSASPEALTGTAKHGDEFVIWERELGLTKFLSYKIYQLSIRWKQKFKLDD